MFKHILLVIILIGSFILWDQRPISHGAGVVAPEKPIMQRVGFKNDISFKHYNLKPRWQIQGTSRVISKKSYWLDDKKHLSPYDMILGWSAMSDERILNQVQLPISNRDYSIKVIRPDLTMNQMKNHMLFMHAIPSTEAISEALKDVREGSVVSYKGYIVDVRDQSDWEWLSNPEGKNGQLAKPQIIWLQELNIQ